MSKDKLSKTELLLVIITMVYLFLSFYFRLLTDLNPESLLGGWNVLDPTLNTLIAIFIGLAGIILSVVLIQIILFRSFKIADKSINQYLKHYEPYVITIITVLIVLGMLMWNYPKFDFIGIGLLAMFLILGFIGYIYLQSSSLIGIIRRLPLKSRLLKKYNIPVIDYIAIMIIGIIGLMLQIKTSFPRIFQFLLDIKIDFQVNFINSIMDLLFAFFDFILGLLDLISFNLNLNLDFLDLFDFSIRTSLTAIGSILIVLRLNTIIHSMRISRMAGGDIANLLHTSLSSSYNGFSKGSGISEDSRGTFFIFIVFSNLFLNSLIIEFIVSDASYQTNSVETLESFNNVLLYLVLLLYGLFRIIAYLIKLIFHKLKKTDYPNLIFPVITRQKPSIIINSKYSYCEFKTESTLDRIEKIGEQRAIIRFRVVNLEKLDDTPPEEKGSDGLQKTITNKTNRNLGDSRGSPNSVEILKTVNEKVEELLTEDNINIGGKDKFIDFASLKDEKLGVFIIIIKELEEFELLIKDLDNITKHWDYNNYNIIVIRIKRRFERFRKKFDPESLSKLRATLSKLFNVEYKNDIPQINVIKVKSFDIGNDVIISQIVSKLENKSSI
jgi:hypothetical protein